MKILEIKFITVGFVFAILILGFVLRYNNLYTWPRHGATFDEFAWTWLGINIIQKGTPISWSSQPQYDNREHLIYQGAAFWIVTPYLEHPPLFGLISGGFSLMNGANSMYDVTLSTMRPLAVILGLITILMVFVLTREAYDKRTALIASLLYATVPTIVIGSRILQNENFFMPIWLLVIFLISRYIKSKNSGYRNIAAILCGLLILAKVPWIAAAGSIVLIFLYHKKYKDILRFLSITLPIGLIYVVYGFYLDSQLFLDLWRLQLNRYDLGFTSIYALFQKPFLVDRFLTDGWIYFGWFAFLLLLTHDFRKNHLIILPMISYFLIFLAGIPDESGHGWYRYPFYPFLIISTALFIKNYFNKNYILTFIFLILVGTTLLQNSWGATFGFSYFIFRLAIVLWCLSLAPTLLSIGPMVRISKISNFIWLFAFIISNIWIVLIYNEQ